MKHALSVIILLVLCLVMVSGITLSYFTGLSNAAEIHFTTGRVELDITDAVGGGDDWKPGEENARNITWTLVNSGTMAVYLKAGVSAVWQKNGILISEKPAVTCNMTGEPVWENENGYWYYPQAIQPGKRIMLSLSFIIDSIQGYQGADCNITLTVDAVQAENNSNREWN